MSQVIPNRTEASKDSKSAPRVSVLMTCYNTRAYLPKAVESVLNQTYSDFEFIIVNDGSTDETAQWLDQLDDPRVTVIHQENQGLGAPINKHLKRCRGELIARVDSDDESFPTRLAKQVELLDSSPEVIMVGTYMCFFNDKSETPVSPLPVRHEDILGGMLRGIHTLPHATLMFRRTLLDKIDGYAWHGVGEDRGLQLDAAKYGKFGMVPELLYKMRLHPTSNAWSGATRVYLGFEFAIERYRQWERGEQESTADEFFQRWENAGFFRRMSIGSKAISSTWHRQSMVDRLNGKRVVSALRLTVAAALHPAKLVGAIWKRLCRR